MLFLSAGKKERGECQPGKQQKFSDLSTEFFIEYII